MLLQNENIITYNEIWSSVQHATDPTKIFSSKLLNKQVQFII